VNSGSFFAREVLCPLMEHVNEEQLLEREPRASTHRFGDGGWPVDHPQRRRDVGDVHGSDDVRRQVLGDQRKQRVEVRVDDRANLLERQSFRGGIDGKHATADRRRRVVAEVDVFPRLELTPVKEADVARHEQYVTLGDRTIEEGLPGP